MNVVRLRVLLAKEWAQVFRDRIVLVTFAFVPLMFVTLGLVGLFGWTQAMADPSVQAEGDEILELAGPMCDGLTGGTCGQLYMGSVLVVLFLLLPAILPAFFAAFSVVGEKTERTLEPLLATPVTTIELVTAKMLAGVIPSVLASWASAVVYWSACVALLAPEVVLRLLAPTWLAAVFVVGPLFAVLAVLVAIMISSRTRDTRTAQQLSGLVAMPMLLVLVGQSFGMFMLDGLLVGVAALALLVVDATLLWLAVQVFDRERILTRWG